MSADVKGGGRASAVRNLEEAGRVVAGHLNLPGEYQVTFVCSGSSVRRTFINVGPLRPAELRDLDPDAMRNLAAELGELARHAGSGGP